MRTRYGFTLLELILAITILGTVVLVALGAFRIGQRSWEKGDAVAEQNQRLRIAVERIRQQLAAATVYAGTGDGVAMGFAGDTMEIRFVSRVAMIPNQEQGLVFVRYRIFETRDRGLALAFYEQPLLALELPPDDGPGPEAYHRLIFGLAEISWHFRGREDTAGASWREGWAAGAGGQLPEAVRLDMRLGQDPPLSVVIRVVNPEDV